MMRKFNLSKEKIEKLYHEERLSTQEIAERFGFCEETVRKRMIKLGIPRRTQSEARTKFSLSKDELKKMRMEDKLTLKEIAKKTEFGYGTIQSWCKKYKIPSPPKKSKRKIVIPQKELERLYYQENLTQKQIANIFNCSDSTINRLRKEYNIPLKKRLSWNKGLKGEEYLKHYKDAKVWNKNLPSEEQPFYSRKHKEETKRKQSEAHLGENNPMYGMVLEKNPNWQGGTSFLPYPPEFNNRLKTKILQRDNWTCQHCGITANKKRGIILHIHHIDFNKNNNDPLNLISLCRRCHGLANAKVINVNVKNA